MSQAVPRGTPPEEEVLRGWQEIERYLRVGGRAARTYHNKFGMPVIRITGQRVWTTKGAIDDWLIRLDRIQREILREVGPIRSGIRISSAVRAYLLTGKPLPEHLPKLGEPVINVQKEPPP